MWGGAPSRRRQALCCCTEFTPEDRPLAGEPLFKTHFGYGPVLRRKGSRVIVYIFGHLFFHSSVDGHLGGFHVLAIVNSAAKNLWVHIYF